MGERGKKTTTTEKKDKQKKRNCCAVDLNVCLEMSCSVQRNRCMHVTVHSPLCNFFPFRLKGRSAGSHRASTLPLRSDAQQNAARARSRRPSPASTILPHSAEQRLGDQDVGGGPRNRAPRTVRAFPVCQPQHCTLETRRGSHYSRAKL